MRLRFKGHSRAHTRKTIQFATCIYIYIYIHTYISLSLYIYIYISISLSLYIYIYILHMFTSTLKDTRKLATYCGLCFNVEIAHIMFSVSRATLRCGQLQHPYVNMTILIYSTLVYFSLVIQTILTTCTDISLHIYIYMYMYTCVYIYIYIYIYTCYMYTYMIS